MVERYIKEGALGYSVESEVPRREFDLIEFYKKLKEKHIITGVEFDEENHCITFLVIKK